MAVGKTTVGRRLAERLDRPFRDSDADLEADQGQSSGAMATAGGLDALHDLEAEHLLRALAESPPSVIAAAASVIDDDRCLASLHPPAVVWLRAPAQVLAARTVSRLAAGVERRSLADDPVEAIQRLAARRDGRYRLVADLIVDVEGRSSDDVTAIIVGWLGGGRGS